MYRFYVTLCLSSQRHYSPIVLTDLMYNHSSDDWMREHGFLDEPEPVDRFNGATVADLELPEVYTILY